MKKIPYLPSLVLLFILFSCSKEKSIEQGSGSNNGNLLVKQVVNFTPTDSVQTFYSYDANNRLSTFNGLGSMFGAASYSSFKLVRDAKGIIQMVVQKSDDLLAAGIDSAVVIVHYDEAKSRYTSKVFTNYDNGTPEKDSTAFTYDASGKVSQQETFVDDGSGSGGYMESTKKEYVYDANGNIIKGTVFEYDNTTGTYSEVSEETLEYDDKVNPLILSNEAFVLDMESMYSAHNITKETYQNLVDPSYNTNGTYSYVYNASGRPTSATVVVQSAGISIITNFVYQ